MELSLEPPSSRYHASWLASTREWGPGHQDGASLTGARGLDMDSAVGFATFVERLLLGADPAQELPPNRVPATNRWIIADGEYAGAVQFRHRLTPFLKRYGGHIGYGVRPSYRRRGLATFGLAAMLPYAARLGLDRALVCCDDDNPGSYRTIERCGGVLEEVVAPTAEEAAAGTTKPWRRYWVPTGSRLNP